MLPKNFEIDAPAVEVESTELCLRFIDDALDPCWSRLKVKALSVARWKRHLLQRKQPGQLQSPTISGLLQQNRL